MFLCLEHTVVIKYVSKFIENSATAIPNVGKKPLPAEHTIWVKLYSTSAYLLRLELQPHLGRYGWYVDKNSRPTLFSDAKYQQHQ